LSVTGSFFPPSQRTAVMVECYCMQEFYSFLEKMNHEIRIPVKSIVGFSEMAMGDDISAKTKGFVEKIKENAEEVLRIINNSLDASKVEFGKIKQENNESELSARHRTAVMPKTTEKDIVASDLILMDKEFQRALQLLFVKSNKDKFNDIINALQQKDIKLAHRLVHSLKSNAGQLGRTSLQQAAADTEQQIRAGENFITEEQLKILNEELSGFLKELSPLLEETAAQQWANLEPLLEPEEVMELFEKLEILLKSGNPESVKLIHDLRAVEESAQLIQQIEDFEFDEAYYTLVKLKERTVLV